MVEDPRTQYESYMRSLQLMEDAGEEKTREYKRIMAEAKLLVPLLYGLPKNEPNNTEDKATQS